MRRLHIFLALLLCTASGLFLGNAVVAAPWTVPEAGASHVCEPGAPPSPGLRGGGEGETYQYSLELKSDAETTLEVEFTLSIEGIKQPFEGALGKVVADLEPGLYAGTVSCEGYFDMQISIDLQNGAGEEYLLMKPKRTVVIKVPDPNGEENPEGFLKGAKVVVEQDLTPAEGESVVRAATEATVTKDGSQLTYPITIEVISADGAVFGLPDGKYKYTVSCDGYTPSSQNFELSTTSPTLNQSVVLVPTSTVQCEITVLNDADDTPVVGATVKVGDAPGTTNDQGVTTISVAPGTYTLTATHAEYGDYSESNVVVEASGLKKTIKMTKKPATTIAYTVTVVDAADETKKLEGAEVTLGSAPALPTSNEGVVTFNVAPGAYELSATFAGYEDFGPVTVTVDADNTEYLIKMTKKAATTIAYTVTVVDAADETKKLEGAEVTLGSAPAVPTSNEGVVTFNVAPGAYELSATFAGYEDFGPVTVTVDADNTEYLIKMTKTPATVNFTVIVKDADGALEGATVYFVDKDGKETTATTASEGKATIDLLEGTYKIYASMAEYITSTPVDQVVSEANQSLEITLEKGEALDYEVTVVDADGNAIEGATVMVGTLPKTTGADGKATFKGIASGTYTVTATLAGYKPFELADVPVDADHLTMEIVLEKIVPVTFTVTVVDKSDPDNPLNLKDVAVKVGEVDGTTDVDGVAKFENIASGTYTVTATLAGYKPFELPDVPVDADHLTMEIVLEKLVTVDYTVTVVNKKDEPVAEVVVTIGEFSQTTDATGTAKFEKLPVDSYEIKAVHADYEEYTDSIEVATDATEYSIILNKKPATEPTATYTLVFNVSDLDGNPVVGVDATIEALGLSAKTDSTGKVVFTAAEKKIFDGVEYTVVFKHEKYADKEYHFTVPEGSTAEKHVFEVSLKLKPFAYTLAVLDADLKPLADVEVTIDRQVVTTSETGLAEFSLMPGEYGITAVKSEYYMKDPDQKAKVDGQKNDTLIMLQASLLKIKVVDVEDEVSVPNVSVSLEKMGADSTFVSVATKSTNKDGIAVFTLQEPGKYCVSVAGKFVPVSDTIDVATFPAEYTLNVKKIRAALKLQVYTLTDDNKQKPAAGATVTIDGVAQTTDSTGVVLFKALLPGSHNVTVELDGYVTSYISVLMGSTDKVQEVVLMPAMKYTVVVLDKATKAPVKDADVVVGKVKGVTDDKGVAIFNLAAGSGYVTQISHEVYRSFTSAPFDITEDKLDTFLVSKGTPVEITFRVTNEDGELLDGVAITLDGKDGVTADGGICKFTVLDSSVYSVAYVIEGYEVKSENLNVGGSGFTKEVVLKKLAMYPVTITVLADGNPAASAVVYVNDKSYTTISDGTVTFDLYAGEYTARITYPGYHDETKTFVANKAVKFQVDLQPMIYNVVLTFLADKEPVAGVLVVEGTTSLGTTDSTGKIVLQLRQGIYKITYEHKDYPTNSVTIDVSGDLEKSIKMQLGPTRDITYTIADEFGTPISGVVVSADGVELGVTDSTGVVTVKLSYKAYKLKFAHPAFEAVEKDVFVTETTPEANSELSMTYKLFKFTLSILNPDRATLASGVKIELVGEIAQKDAVTDGSTEFFTFDLPAGAYNLILSKGQLSDTLKLKIPAKKDTVTLPFGAIGPITFHVVDKSGKNLEDAAVSILNAKGGTVLLEYTDTTGTLVVGNLPWGQYDYLVKRVGHNEAKGSVTVDAEAKIIEVTLQWYDDSPVVSAQLASVNAYPNPVGDVLNVDNTMDVVRVSIVNLMGSVVKSVRPMGESRVLLDVHDLPAGIYMVLLEVDGARRVIRIVKN